MRRAKFKFPGRQKIVVSRNWGFTSYSREDYVQWKREGRLVKDGVNAKVCPPGHSLCSRQHFLSRRQPLHKTLQAGWR